MNHMSHYTKACLLAGVFAAALAAAEAQTCQITLDTYLDSASPTKNFGASGSDKVVINSTSECRTLFELPSSLWSYSLDSIQSVTVSFYVWNDNTGTYNVHLSPLTDAFSVSGATWNTSDGVNSWTTSGGDYDSSVAVTGVKGALGVNPGDSNGRFFTFDITSLLSNSTVLSELENYGAMLWIDETIPSSGQRYASFTSADSTTYSVTYKPSVTVTLVPEPCSGLLALGGVVAFLCRRQAERSPTNQE